MAHCDADIKGGGDLIRIPQVFDDWMKAHLCIAGLYGIDEKTVQTLIPFSHCHNFIADQSESTFVLQLLTGPLAMLAGILSGLNRVFKQEQ